MRRTRKLFPALSGNGLINMASHRGDRTRNPTVNAEDVSKIDLLLHPELLSQEFIQLMLHEVRLGATSHNLRVPAMTIIIIV